jgi:hypothetical protein
VNACVHTYTKPQTSSTRSRGLGRRIHGSVEDTKLSTNKQHSLLLSVWTNRVRNTFRKQAGWAKLQKVRATAATNWTTRVWYLQSSKEGAELSKSGSFKDEREWGKKCFEDLERRMGRLATSTWSTDFLLREGSSREELGKWLKNKSIPWH